MPCARELDRAHGQTSSGRASPLPSTTCCLPSAQRKKRQVSRAPYRHTKRRQPESASADASAGSEPGKRGKCRRRCEAGAAHSSQGWPADLPGCPAGVCRLGKAGGPLGAPEHAATKAARRSPEALHISCEAQRRPAQRRIRALAQRGQATNRSSLSSSTPEATASTRRRCWRLRRWTAAAVDGHRGQRQHPLLAALRPSCERWPGLLCPCAWAPPARR
mmetsp:Transcript_47122/g.105899  ORF Transcript_47122/g.105899 Transcript_47122/m.105899 type:complete len:219 (+) Transcript_47122:245-901(+)